MGVLGGTFDPLHLGHLRAAEAVRDAAKLDRVLFVPASVPPHKRAPMTATAHRLAMLERALANEPFFEISRVEIERGGPSYTIDTMDALEAASRGDRWYFITGTDAFSEIRTWKSWRDLLGRHSFVVHERPGFPIEEVRRVLPEGVPSASEDEGAEVGDPAVWFVRRPMLDVSSTAIRLSVLENRSIRFLVPEVVADYIREFRLYR